MPTLLPTRPPPNPPLHHAQNNPEAPCRTGLQARPSTINTNLAFCRACGTGLPACPSLPSTQSPPASADVFSLQCIYVERRTVLAAAEPHRKSLSILRAHFFRPLPDRRLSSSRIPIRPVGHHLWPYRSLSRSAARREEGHLAPAKSPHSCLSVHCGSAHRPHYRAARPRGLRRH